MPINIDVRQNEIVVVKGSSMSKVSSMFTMGMNPCIGLVLWSEEMCALGHIHDWETTPIAQCSVVVKHFCRVSSPSKRKAVIVMAKVGDGEEAARKAWHSEAMKVDLDKVIPLAYQVVKRGDPADVKISLENGELDYTFKNGDATKLARMPKEDWTGRPDSQQNKFLVIGVFGPNNTIQYVKGDQPEQLEQVLSAVA